MTFWSSEQLQQKIPALNIVSPYDARAVKHAAYELTLGAETYQTSQDDGVKKVLSAGSQVNIPPGQFGLLTSEEIVTIPDMAIGLISIKSSFKVRGLVNVSGFHVDPGFTGQLHFAVYNAGSQPIVLERGKRLFLLWLCDLDRHTEDIYNGSHNNQQGLTTDEVMKIQGEVASPAALLARIIKIEHKFSLIWQLAIALGAGIVLCFLGWFLSGLVARHPPASARPTVWRAPKDLNRREPLWHRPPMPNSRSAQHAANTRP